MFRADSRNTVYWWGRAVLVGAVVHRMLLYQLASSFSGIHDRLMTAELHIGQIFSGYLIEAVAGRGGMGVVYRATQIGLGRTVALKLITPAVAADEDFRERLQRESQLLASVDHPNVITVYEAGEADGQLFMSMRYVEGMDLRSLLAAQGPLAPEQAARIVAQVGAGLDAAHANGLVHRDVKPANVLIEQAGSADRAYLSDFGLTKKANLASAITGSGQWVGTLDYAAPEQIEGRPVDARTDVYALGCVLFETLTGRAPYVRDSDAAKLWAHMHEPPPSARALRPGLPAELDQVIACAMAKEPARRYPSAGALGRAAIAAAGGELITDLGHSVAVGPAAASGAASVTALAFGGERRAVAAGVVAVLAAGALLAIWAPWNSQEPSIPGTASVSTTVLVQQAPTTTASNDVETNTPSTRGSSSAPDPSSSPSKRAAPSDGAAAAAPRTRDPSSTPDSSSSTSKRAACADHRDNDGDGKTDYPGDRGCSSASDRDERNRQSSTTPPPPPPPPPPVTPPANPVVPATPATTTPPPAAPTTPRLAVCKDGLDNDSDGKTDYPADRDCSSPTDPAEKAAACADRLDNDSDGKTDYPADPQCTSADDTAEKI
jgi:serine/threonine protein kinase